MHACQEMMNCYGAGKTCSPVLYEIGFHIIHFDDDDNEFAKMKKCGQMTDWMNNYWMVVMSECS